MATYSFTRANVSDVDEENVTHTSSVAEGMVEGVRMSFSYPTSWSNSEIADDIELELADKGYATPVVSLT